MAGIRLFVSRRRRIRCQSACYCIIDRFCLEYQRSIGDAVAGIRLFVCAVRRIRCPRSLSAFVVWFIVKGSAAWDL